MEVSLRFYPDHDPNHDSAPDRDHTHVPAHDPNRDPSPVRDRDHDPGPDHDRDHNPVRDRAPGPTRAPGRRLAFIGCIISACQMIRLR